MSQLGSITTFSGELVIARSSASISLLSEMAITTQLDLLRAMIIMLQHA
jgi:hypothetical protein